MPKLITEIDEATWRALQQRAQQHGRSLEEEAASLLRTTVQLRMPIHRLLPSYLLAEQKRFALNYAYRGYSFDAAYLSEASEPLGLIAAAEGRNLWARVRAITHSTLDLPLLLVADASQARVKDTTLLKRFQAYPTVSAIGLLQSAEYSDMSLQLPVSEARMRALETLSRVPQLPEVVWMDIVLNPNARYEWRESLWGEADVVYGWDARQSQFRPVYDAATRRIRRAIAQALRDAPPAPPPPSAEWQQRWDALLQQVHQRTAHIPPEEAEADITEAFEEYRRECGS